MTNLVTRVTNINNDMDDINDILEIATDAGLLSEVVFTALELIQIKGDLTPEKALLESLVIHDIEDID